MLIMGRFYGCLLRRPTGATTLIINPKGGFEGASSPEAD